MQALFNLRVSAGMQGFKRLAQQMDRVNLVNDFLMSVGQDMKVETKDAIFTQTSPVAPEGGQRKFAKRSDLSLAIRPGGLTLFNTGRYLQSLVAPAPRIIGNGVQIGTNHPGALVHHFGAVIRPKRAKMLAIPASRGAQLAGSARGVRRRGMPVKKNIVFASQVTIPARPVLGISNAFRTKLRAKWKRYVLSGRV